MYHIYSGRCNCTTVSTTRHESEVQQDGKSSQSVRQTTHALPGASEGAVIPGSTLVAPVSYVTGTCCLKMLKSPYRIRVMRLTPAHRTSPNCRKPPATTAVLILSDLTTNLSQRAINRDTPLVLRSSSPQKENSTLGKQSFPHLMYSDSLGTHRHNLSPVPVPRSLCPPPPHPPSTPYYCLS